MTSPNRALRSDAGLKRAFLLLGKRWNGELITVLADGPLGFAGLHRDVPGISERILSDRLRELTDAGLVTRAVTPGPPARSSYELSSHGYALVPLIDELAQWAEVHLPDHRTDFQ